MLLFIFLFLPLFLPLVISHQFGYDRNRNFLTYFYTSFILKKKKDPDHSCSKMSNVPQTFSSPESIFFKDITAAVIATTGKDHDARKG